LFIVIAIYFAIALHVTIFIAIDLLTIHNFLSDHLWQNAK